MGSFFQSQLYHERLSVFSTIVKTIIRNIRNKKFEPEVSILGKFVKSGDICFDIGGAYGRYALPLSRIAGLKGSVYSFEPGRYSYTVFSWIKKFHRLNNVILTKKALSSNEGRIKLFSPQKRTGKVGASLSYIDEGDHKGAMSEVVEMTTLDRFTVENGIKRADFIKCDTEGSEFLVYKGAEKLINQYLPTVLSEVDQDNLNRYGHKVRDLEGFFKEKGYRILAFRQNQFKEIRQIEESGNFFFVHESKLKGIVI